MAQYNQMGDQPQYNPQPQYGGPPTTAGPQFDDVYGQPYSEGERLSPKPFDAQERLNYASGGGYRDVWAAIAFVAHLIIMIIILAASGSSSTSPDPSDPSNFPVGKAVGTLFGVSFIAALFAAGWLWVMKRYAGGIIKISIFVSVTAMALSAIIAFAGGNGFLGVVWLLFAVIAAVYYYSVRNRIPFANACLKVSSQIIQDYPGPVGVAFGFTALQILWIVFWVATVSNAYTGGGGAAFLLLVSFYWTTEVLMNMTHVSTAGVAATWFFYADPRNPTRDSLKRAATTSFGSICFGSLLLAIVGALRAMVRMARDRDDCLSCIVTCIVNCLHDVIEYFNIYAFVQVAVYGKPFIQAGKDTWELFKAQGWSAIVNDDLTGFVLGLGAMIGGVVTGAFALLIARGSNDLKSFSTFMGVVGFLIGVAIVFLVMRVIRSAIATIFVCWAEDPVALYNSRPEQYTVMADALAQRYGQQFVPQPGGGHPHGMA